MESIFVPTRLGNLKPFHDSFIIYEFLKRDRDSDNRYYTVVQKQIKMKHHLRDKCKFAKAKPQNNDHKIHEKEK